MGTRTIADTAYGILEDKKARDIEIIDISEVSILADYFIICSGTSTTHIKTLADELEAKMDRPAGCTGKAIERQVDPAGFWTTGRTYIQRRGPEFSTWNGWADGGSGRQATWNAIVSQFERSCLLWLFDKDR